MLDEGTSTWEQGKQSVIRMQKTDRRRERDSEKERGKQGGRRRERRSMR